MRIVFFGTPQFAVPSLETLAREHEIRLVVAQPDRPSGRGMQVHAPAVAVRARELGLPLAQPESIRSEEFLARIRETGADAGIVVAYGKILPKSLLQIPKHGFLNVHGSILPKYRGAAPIQRAIEAGERTTGVSIMAVDEKLDHGPVFETVQTPIGPDERAPALAARLATLGAQALLSVVNALEQGEAHASAQDDAAATHAAKIEKREGSLTWDLPAATIYNRFRAFDPWPGLFLESRDGTLKLTDMRLADGAGEPGTVLSVNDSVVVAAHDGAIRILEMQRPGKPRASAGDVARGLGWSAGTSLR